MSLYDSASLLENIKGLAFVPLSQATYSDDDLLRLADNEIQTAVVPMMMATREEYFVTYTDYTIVSGQDGYDIPSRAIGAKLKDVTIINGQGVEISVPFIAAEEVPYNTTTFVQYNQQYCFLRGNKLHLFPNNNPNVGTLRLYYFIRPNKLVQTSKVAQISSIDTGSNTVTVANLPTTLISGVRSDFVRGTPHFNILQADATIVTTGSSTITYSSLPSGLAAGDYVCVAGETPVIQVPFELYPVVAQRVVVKLMETQGDANALASAQAKLKEIEKNVLTLITPRIEGEPKKIVGIFTTLNSPRKPNRFGNY